MEKNKIKLIIIGSYGAGNIGDEAMKTVLTHYFSNYDLAFLSGHPEGKNEYPHLPFGLRSFFRFNWWVSFKKLNQADFVIFGGGGLWAEHESIRAILLWTWHFFWAYALRKPTYLLALSFGPFKSRFGRFFTRWVLSSATYVSVRDETSLIFCQQLFPYREYERTSDLCFLFEGKRKKKVKRVAINLRPWNFDRATFKLFFKWLKEHAYELLFIANDPSDQEVLAEFGEVIVPQNFDELCEYLSSCELVVGMRLHFLIAAALCDCKILPLSYSPKVKGVMNELYLDVLDPEYWSLPELENAFDSAKKASAVSAYSKEALDSLQGLSL